MAGGWVSGGGGSSPPRCATFRRVPVPLRGPGQSPVLPFASGCCFLSAAAADRKPPPPPPPHGADFLEALKKIFGLNQSAPKVSAEGPEENLAQYFGGGGVGPPPPPV